MNINVFENYRIKCKGKYSYNTPSYDCPNDWHTERVRWQKTMSGGKLMEFIAKELNEHNLIEIDFRDDYIYCGHFDPNTGECRDIDYIIERVKDKK